jgi:hypothetical protein
MKDSAKQFLMRTFLRGLVVTGFPLIAFVAEATLTINNFGGPDSNGIWDYSATLSNGMLQAGDGFTIYGFGNYQLDSITAVPNWTANASASSSGSLSTYDLTFTYSGPTITQTTGSTFFIGFLAQDTSGAAGQLAWSSEDPLLNGSPGTSSVGVVLGPAPLPIPDSGATFGLLAFAFLGLAATRGLTRLT